LPRKVCDNEKKKKNAGEFFQSIDITKVAAKIVLLSNCVIQKNMDFRKSKIKQ